MKGRGPSSPAPRDPAAPIHPDAALRIVEGLVCRLGSERVSLAEALGRFPAEEPVAVLEQPPFDKATMDGYAYASSDGGMAEAGAEFELVGSLAAGDPPPPPLVAGSCVRIMTGAPVPEGAVAVHRFERSRLEGHRLILERREDDLNIVRRGANRRAGDVLFPRRRLRPQDLALLASDGLGTIEVVRRPRVVVLSTGNELRAPGSVAAADLSAGAIYDSNGSLLAAQAESAGCEVSFAGIVRDEEAALREAVVAASRQADLLIVSGGVSAGSFDYVPSVLEAAGYVFLFRKIAVRPGMPAILGRLEPGATRGGEGGAGTSRIAAGFVYGMPGNPVSAFVNFELFVKPLIWRFAGLSYEPPVARAVLASAVRRDVAERVEFLPVEFDGTKAFPLRYTGSTMLDALSKADALVRLEIGQREIPEGAEVLARLI